MLLVKDFRVPFLLAGVTMAGFVTLCFGPSGVAWRLFDSEAVRGRGEELLVGVSAAEAGKGPESWLAISSLNLSGSFLAQNSSIVMSRSLTPQYLYLPSLNWVYILVSSRVEPGSGSS